MRKTKKKKYFENALYTFVRGSVLNSPPGGDYNSPETGRARGARASCGAEIKTVIQIYGETGGATPEWRVRERERKKATRHVSPAPRLVDVAVSTPRRVSVYKTRGRRTEAAKSPSRRKRSAYIYGIHIYLRVYNIVYKI